MSGRFQARDDLWLDFLFGLVGGESHRFFGGLDSCLSDLVLVRRRKLYIRGGV